MSVFAVLLGVCFAFGSLIFISTLDRAFSAVQSGTVSDVVVRQAGVRSGQGEVPEPLVPRVAAVPGVAQVDGQVLENGVYLLGKDGQPLGAANVPGSLTNFHNGRATGGLPGLVVLEGRAPTRAGEVAIDPKAAAEGGYRIGDQVTIVTSGETPVITKTLVGLVTYGAGGSPGATLVTMDTAAARQLSANGEGYQQLWVVAAPGISPATLRDRISAVLPAGTEALTGAQAADLDASTINKALRFVTAALWVFAATSLLAGGFLIANTFAMLVNQRARELALLRAIGASKAQVRRMMLLEALVVGVVGAAAGLVCGYLLARLIRGLFRRFGYDLSATPLVVPWTGAVIATALGVAVTLFAAYLPARRASAMSPAAALRDDPTPVERSLWLRAGAGIGVLALAALILAPPVRERFSTNLLLAAAIVLVLIGVTVLTPVLARPVIRTGSWLGGHVWGQVARLAGTNALRNPRRTGATATALMMGTALVAMMGVFAGSARTSVDDLIADTFRSDYIVSAAYGAPFSPKIADNIQKVPGVQWVARVRQGGAYLTAGGQQSAITLAATEPTPFLHLLDLHFESGTPADWHGATVVVSHRFAQTHRLRVGQSVAIDFLGKPYSVRVAGIMTQSPLAVVDVITTMEQFNAMGGGGEERLVFVSRDPSANAASVRAGLIAALGGNTVVSVQSQAQFAAQQREPIDQVLRVIYALLGLAIVIAFLGIVNTLVLAVAERRREIGLLRAVAMTRGQVRRMVRLEALAICLLGSVVGLGTGILLGWLLQRSQADRGVNVLDIPWLQLAAALLIAVVAGVVAAWWPARRAAALPPLAAIATE
ncbi:ABC transporter permease [Branchiibius sp. NY16-3462-2]|uniref:ABC transporter permease n=1 Tax=Branchiibius sp. NY16-3462-2 TaxID=1807500 RepID=UPI0025BBE4BF|nr:ABC transporter permease [Branchiibius sp. NY16-3462-2]